MPRCRVPSLKKKKNKNKKGVTTGGGGEFGRVGRRFGSGGRWSPQVFSKRAVRRFPPNSYTYTGNLPTRDKSSKRRWSDGSVAPESCYDTAERARLRDNGYRAYGFR